ncbi:unnamed protein product [Mytilus coruscus]|uniref:G-protein coupled receptors family 1 profile domain-containing protein n=1 Tax=Mytilus coruscus TaxID=42192 RepID=A0A6J8ATW4_MYTCO|nr:unnamed protein product [Mytilus coruscus]
MEMSTIANNVSLSELNADKIQALLPNIILMVLVTTVSLLFNITVMWIRWRKMSETTDLRKYIPYLALLDMISTLISGTIFIYLNIVLWKHSLFCVMGRFAIKVTQCISALFVLFVAVQRYLKICHFLKHGFTKTIKIFVLIGCFTILVIKAFPEFILSARNADRKSELTNYECTEKLSVIFIIFDNFMMLLVIVAILLIYILCIFAIFKRSNRVSKHTTKKKRPRSPKQPKRKRKQNDLYYYTVGKSFGIILKCDEISKDTMSFAKSNLELGKPYKERKSIKNVSYKNEFHKKLKTDCTAQNMKNGSKVNAKHNEESSLSNNRISKRSFSVEDISHTKVRKVTRFASAINIPELSDQAAKGRNNPSCSFHSEMDESTVNIFDNNRKPKKTKMAAARRSHKYKMINTVLILIMLSMIIGYLPEIVLNMIDIFTPSWVLQMQDTTRSFYQLFKRFYVITYITNPILYNLMDVEFVEHLRSIFQTCRREA